MVDTSFLIAYSIYWVCHTNGEFNLRKTNAANEGWLADCHTDVYIQGT